ncbi:MAG TPA: enoyl-CoA hydratase/isomerase family protein [Pseudonocardia sp.]|jgi:enoyl-CoA hydratase|nr:enoyl-CoA hydratase/isomerase family protein [Pseudonocardia sp.]
MDYELPDGLLVREDGPVRIVELCRPDRLNVITAEIHGGLATVWGQLRRDPEARAVVLTAQGPAFSAGGDMAWFERLQHDHDERRRSIHEAADIVRAMVGFPLPVVAAVNGAAVGLGCSLAVTSDIVLMAEGSYFMDPHVSIGVVAGDGGAALWPWLTSMLRAKEYLLTGDPIPAETAVQIGLANRVVAANKVQDDALALAHRLARQPARAVSDTKRSLHMHLDHAVGAVLQYALATESECFLTDEHRERVAAFRARSERRG